MIFRRNRYGGVFIIDENTSSKAKSNRKVKKEAKLRKDLDKLESKASNIFTSAKSNNKYAERGFRLDEERADLIHESKYNKTKLSKPLTTEDHNKKMINAFLKEDRKIQKQLQNNMSTDSRKALEKQRGQLLKKYTSRMRSKGKNNK